MPSIQEIRARNGIIICEDEKIAEIRKPVRAQNSMRGSYRGWGSAGSRLVAGLVGCDYLAAQVGTLVVNDDDAPIELSAVLLQVTLK